MTWIVKSWRYEEQAAGVVAAAERDARRIVRAAAREAGDAAAYLDELEHFGVTTRCAVREQRRELAMRRADVEPTVTRTRPAAPAAGQPRAAHPSLGLRPRSGRVSMRDSNLAELFRATAAS